MEFVPAGAGAFVASCSGIVIAETVDDGVPEGAVFLDEERFAEGDPDVINGQETAEEVFDIEVFGGFD